MYMIETVLRLLRMIESAATMHELALLLADATAVLGFKRYALTHHDYSMRANGSVMRIHNYPAAWVEFYDQHGLGVCDPVHRASHVTSLGFAWRRIPELIGLAPRDLEVMRLGRSQGIGDGFTVPVNVPGEAYGSVTFVNPAGPPLPEPMLPAAQLVGSWAFEAARRICLGRGVLHLPGSPVLTLRQREIAILVGCGKTDEEIGDILAISKLTAGLHVRNACERYGVAKRTLMAVRALFDGTITFPQIFGR